MGAKEFRDKTLAAAEAGLTEPMPDAGRMLERQLDIDKNLATSMLCFGACYGLKDQAWSWYLWAKEGKDGLPAITRYASETLAAQAASFGDCYACSDAERMLKEASEEMAGAETAEDVEDVAFAVAHYMITLYYWVDASIPWADLSPIHADLVRARMATGIQHGPRG